jgi:hypothetical protein
MKHDVEIGSSVVTYIPNFIKTGSSIQRLIGRDTQKHRHPVDHIHIFSFFKIRKGIKKKLKDVYNKQLAEIT